MADEPKVHLLFDGEGGLCLSILGNPGLSTCPDWPSVTLSKGEARMLINKMESMENGYVRSRA